MSADTSTATHNPALNPDPLLTVADAATYTGLSVSYWRDQVFRRSIPVTRIGNRVLIRRSVLDALIAAGTTPARSE